MKTKVTVLLTTGGTKVVDIEHKSAGMTDEDVLAQTANTWNHALVCQQEHHLMQFRLSLRGDLIILAPESILGFSLEVPETLQ